MDYGLPSLVAFLMGHLPGSSCSHGVSIMRALTNRQSGGFFFTCCPDSRHHEVTSTDGLLYFYRSNINVILLTECIMSRMVKFRWKLHENANEDWLLVIYSEFCHVALEPQFRLGCGRAHIYLLQTATKSIPLKTTLVDIMLSNIQSKQITAPSQAGEQQAQDQKQMPMDWWFEDVCMLDMDYFVRTIAAIKAKGVRPDLIGGIISHYAMKWLPGLIQEQETSTNLLENHPDGKEIGDKIENSGSESFTSVQRKNKFLLETLVSILPAEKNAVSCSFLLRLLRMANIVGGDTVYKMELERRIGLQLEQASLSDLLIPSFAQTCDTLFDVQLVYRLLKRFLAQDERNTVDEVVTISSSQPLAKLSTAKVKVAKLLDNYLAEIAHDANLTVPNFEALAEALPSYARTCDDGLYRAIDTYLKAHPVVSEIDRKRLCRLMDCQKLSMDACMHAAQNERLPIRTVIQVLFCEQMKLKTAKTPEESDLQNDQQSQCVTHGCDKVQYTPSEKESGCDIQTLQLEILKMREDFAKLQHICSCMQQQVDKISKNKSIFPWSNGWKKLSKLSTPFSSNSNAVQTRDDQCSMEEQDFVLTTPRTPRPQETKIMESRRKSARWRRNSVS
eukprot:Gb_16354 [translate_table: standard]